MHSAYQQYGHPGQQALQPNGYQNAGQQGMLYPQQQYAAAPIHQQQAAYAPGPGPAAAPGWAMPQAGPPAPAVHATQLYMPGPAMMQQMTPYQQQQQQQQQEMFAHQQAAYAQQQHAEQQQAIFQANMTAHADAMEKKRQQEWPYAKLSRMLLMVSFHTAKVGKFQADRLKHYINENKKEYMQLSKPRDGKCATPRTPWKLDYDVSECRAAYIWMYFPAAVTYTLRAMMAPFDRVLREHIGSDGLVYTNDAAGHDKRCEDLMQVPEWLAWSRFVKAAKYLESVPLPDGSTVKQLVPVRRCRLLVLGGGAASEVTGFQYFAEWLRHQQNVLAHALGELEPHEEMPVYWDLEVCILDLFGADWAKSAQEMMELTDPSDQRFSVIPGTRLKSTLVTPHSAFEIHAGRQTDIHFRTLNFLEEVAIGEVETIALHFQPDVVLMPKCASVLWADERKAVSQRMMSTMMAALPQHSLLMVIDNKSQRNLRAWFQGCSSQDPAVAAVRRYVGEDVSTKGPWGVPPYEGPIEPEPRTTDSCLMCRSILSAARAYLVPAPSLTCKRVSSAGSGGRASTCQEASAAQCHIIPLQADLNCMLPRAAHGEQTCERLPLPIALPVSHTPRAPAADRSAMPLCVPTQRGRARSSCCVRCGVRDHYALDL